MAAFIADMTLEALRERGAAGLSAYASILCAACEQHPPPFGQDWYGDTYRDFAVDPTWLARSLIENASKEGEGSRKLWHLAGRITDLKIRESVRQHAIDESRHVKYYLAMLRIVFPKATDNRTWKELRALSPGYGETDHPPPQRPSTSELILDEIVQMNIGEIRTRIHQLLLRPVIIAHCLPAQRHRLQKVLDILLEDETRHIAYTAKIIDDGAQAGRKDYLAQIMVQRFADFNSITLREVSAQSFEGA